MLAMSDELNPQAKQMADESMVRTLAAQANAIWPQEEPLFRRYGLGDDIRILDAGCGTGEIASRLARLYPRSAVLGVDIIESHLELARRMHADLAGRVTFENRSVFELGLPDRVFDLVVCRHVLQAIPHASRVLRELARVTRPGGRLHLIAEDYGMIQFQARELDSEDFWQEGPRAFGKITGTDLHVGRRAYSYLRALGLREITVDFVVVDTLRVPRDTFAAIWEAWRDGYTDAIAEYTRFTREEVLAHFEDMLATIRDPEGYGVWFVPVVSAVVP
jgi:ubiquinone/menaquinone biosynthesis C-methylase UbiE